VLRATVLVVGYNSERWLTTCLNSVATASQTQVQLCFVDNHSNPTFESLDLSIFRGVEHLKTDSPLGFAEANNFGIRQTQFDSDFTVFLNQDTVSTAGWIDACVSCFDDDPRLGILSPGLRTYDFSEWDPNLLACVRESNQAIGSAHSSVVELRNVTAAAMIIRTDVLHEVGPFDPVFGSYYEDYDLCRRVRNAGYKVGACLAAQVGHFSGSVTSTPAAELRRSRLLLRNRMIHRLRENPDRRLQQLVHYLALELPRNVVRGILRTESSQTLATTLGANWDMAKILARLVSRRRDEEEWNQFLQDFRSQTAKNDFP
jgi:GT2 family glycosyltransferase